MRHRQRIKHQLAERGVTARGQIIERMPLTVSGGSTSVVRYRFQSRDGSAHELTAFDTTDVARRWRVGREAVVRYDPDDPDIALLEEPVSLSS
jgi:hypothetical protein